MKPTFALIGLPTDRHSSYLRGPAKGPAFIRAALACDGTTVASEDGRELGLDLIINDCGDAPLREADGDDEIIERSVRAPLREGHCPILLGGDHAVTYPVLRAIHAQHGPVDILHFDARPDLYAD
jgi:arginase